MVLGFETLTLKLWTLKLWKVARVALELLRQTSFRTAYFRRNTFQEIRPCNLRLQDP